MAGGLALGYGEEKGVIEARLFTRAAIKGAVNWRMGKGHGPVDSWGNRRVTKVDTS